MQDIPLFHMNAWAEKGEDWCASTKQDLKLKKSDLYQKIFEGLVIRFQQTVFALIYRPPYSKKNPQKICAFVDEFSEFLTSLLQGKFLNQ